MDDDAHRRASPEPTEHEPDDVEPIVGKVDERLLYEIDEADLAPGGELREQGRHRRRLESMRPIGVRGADTRTLLLRRPHELLVAEEPLDVRACRVGASIAGGEGVDHLATR